MTTPAEARSARRNGQLEVGGGIAVLILAWLVVHYWASDTVAKCNTVIGNAYANQHVKAGAGCTAANFIADYQWVFYLLGVAMIVVGACTIAYANPKFRAFLDED